MFKHVRGKNGTTSLLPLDSKKGGNVTYVMKKETEQEKMTENRPNGENENLY